MRKVVQCVPVRISGKMAERVMEAMSNKVDSITVAEVLRELFAHRRA